MKKLETENEIVIPQENKKGPSQKCLVGPGLSLLNLMIFWGSLNTVTSGWGIVWGVIVVPACGIIMVVSSAFTFAFLFSRNSAERWISIPGVVFNGIIAYYILEIINP